MGIFTTETNRLVWNFNGEKLVLEPWGENSLRVRSVMMGDIMDTEYALLKVDNCNAQIDISEQGASITYGKIKAVIRENDWTKECVISFYNNKGELLLKELDQHGALMLKSRKFKPIIGGDFRLTVSFESNEKEKLYGMGQYQQEFMDIKNCSFSLRTGILK